MNMNMTQPVSVGCRLVAHEVREIYAARPPRSPHDKTFIPSSCLVHEIAQKFCVGNKTVRNIWNRRQWRDVTKSLWSDDERAAEEMSVGDRSIIPAQTRKPGRPKRALVALQAQGSGKVECEPQEKTGFPTEVSAAFSFSSVFATAPAALPFEPEQQHPRAASLADEFQEQRHAHATTPLPGNQDIKPMPLAFPCSSTDAWPSPLPVAHERAAQVSHSIAAEEWSFTKPLNAGFSAPMEFAFAEVAPLADAALELAGAGAASSDEMMMGFELIGQGDPIDPFARDCRRVMQSFAHVASAEEEEEEQFW